MNLSTNNFSLDGKVALITGASYGIGYAIAKGLHAAGAKIVFNDIKQEFVDRGLASYAADGIDAKGYVCDVTDEDAVNAMVAQIERELISLRTREALQARKTQGIKLGRPKGKGKSKLDANKDDILGEMRFLENLFNNIISKAKASKSPSLLYFTTKLHECWINMRRIKSLNLFYIQHHQFQTIHSSYQILYLKI